jgi:hypothetical protein
MGEEGDIKGKRGRIEWVWSEMCGQIQILVLVVFPTTLP